MRLTSEEGRKVILSSFLNGVSPSQQSPSHQMMRRECWYNDKMNPSELGRRCYCWQTEYSVESPKFWENRFKAYEVDVHFCCGIDSHRFLHFHWVFWKMIDRSLGLSVGQFVVDDSIPCNFMTTLPTLLPSHHSRKRPMEEKEKESAKEQAHALQQELSELIHSYCSTLNGIIKVTLTLLRTTACRFWECFDRLHQQSVGR